MELTLCEKQVLQCIYMDEPGTEGGIQSVRGFTQAFGYTFTEEEISHALDVLISQKLVMVITPEVKSTMDPENWTRK